MANTANKDNGHGDNPDAEPEVNPHLKGVADETKRDREETDCAFLEKGVISLRHFSEAKHRLFDYALQQTKTFRVEDLRHLILVRDRINTFIERVEWANEGHEEVERLLQLYENEGENWRLNRPDW